LPEVSGGRGNLILQVISPPSTVESCSTDTLRNAVKVLQDLDVLVPGQSGDRTQDQALRVANTNRLVGVVKNLTLLRS
jgi:hypothetical protein